MTGRKRARAEVMPENSPASSAVPEMVQVTIRAGHTHRGELFSVDAVRTVSTAERDLLAKFDGLVRA